MTRNKLYLIVFLIVVALLSVVPSLHSYYLEFMIYLYLFYVLLSIGLHFISGFVGLHSLGNAVFFGLGAYSFALIGRGDIFYAILGNILFSVCCSLVFLPMLRIRGIYFVLSTIFICEVVKLLFCALEDITGGAAGVHLTASPGHSFENVYYLTLIFSISSVVISILLENSRFGLYFGAIRENEEAAASLGINTVKYKLFALMLSGFFTGLGGIIFGYYMLYIEPNTYFSASWSLTPLFITIVGGEGYTMGPLFGSAFFVLLMEFTKGLGEWYLSVYAALLILVMIFIPEGIVGVINRIKALKGIKIKSHVGS